MLNSMTKQNLMAYIDTCMGGRAAEDVFFGNLQVTSGCSSDLAQATRAAYQLVRGGMEHQNLLAAEQDGTSDEYQGKLDLRVEALLRESYERVKTLLKGKARLMQLLSTELLVKETLSAKEMLAIIG
jgi:ATP-dependent metalloprotease